MAVNGKDKKVPRVFLQRKRGCYWIPASLLQADGTVNFIEDKSIIRETYIDSRSCWKMFKSFCWILVLKAKYTIAIFAYELEIKINFYKRILFWVLWRAYKIDNWEWKGLVMIWLNQRHWASSRMDLYLLIVGTTFVAIWICNLVNKSCKNG